MKKLILLLFALSLILTPIAYSLDEIELWPRWGRTRAGINSMSFDEGYYSSLSFFNSTYSSYGGYYQPLIGSIDSDDVNKNYVIFQTSDYLIVLDEDASLYSQLAGNWRGQPGLLTTIDANNDTFESGETYIITHDNDTIYVYGISSGSFTQYWNYTNSSLNISFLDNGIKCFYTNSFNYDSEMCLIKYVEYTNESLAALKNGGILKIRITSGDYPEYSYELWEYTDFNNTLTTIPNIADFGTDGIEDFVMWSDYDNDANYGFTVASAFAQNVYLRKDDLFTASSEYTDSYGRNNPLILDFNGGYGEVYFYKIKDEDSGGANLYVYCYDFVGNACSGFPVEITSGISNIDSDVCGTYGSSKAWLSNPVVMNIEGDEVLGFFGFGYGSVNIYECGQRYCGGASTADFNFLGYIYSNGTIYQDYECPTPDFSVGAGGRNEVHLTAADFDNDNSDEFINLLGIFQNQTIDNYYALGLTGYGWAIPVDVGLDNFIDIALETTSSLIILSTAGTNSPPTLTGSFGRVYGNPVCVNTTLRFTAEENENYEQPFGEGIDEERIAGDCFESGDIDNGSYSDTQPYFDCYYNETGTFYAVMYIQDFLNDDYYDEYETILVQVIDGTPGVTCNIIGSGSAPGETSDEGTSSEQTTNNQIDDVMGSLFGTGSSSDKLKLIIGLAIVIGIIVMAAQNGITSGAALLGIGILGILLTTFIGLITPAIIILVLAGFLLLVIIGKALGGSSPGGE